MTGSAASRTFNGLPAAVAEAWSSKDWIAVTVLVGVSGGADSVALLRALHELRLANPKARGRLLVAHFHHATRESADEDLLFVQSLAESLGLQCVTAKRSLDDCRASHVGSELANSEESLRMARYEFFRQMAAAEGARYVALAHTANDQVETVLHRVLRGSGLRGMAGIPVARQLAHGVTLIRPLLRVSRDEVEEYLSKIGQEYREDPTNANLDYTRNAIRHLLLPLLEKQFNPEVCSAVLRLSYQAKEAHATLATLAESQLDACAEFRTDSNGATSVRLPRKELRSVPDYLLRLMFMLAWERNQWPQQAMGDAEWRRLAALAADKEAESRPQANMFPGGVRVTIDRETVTLTRLAT